MRQKKIKNPGEKNRWVDVDCTEFCDVMNTEQFGWFTVQNEYYSNEYYSRLLWTF